MYIPFCLEWFLTLLLGIILLATPGGTNPLDGRDLYDHDATKHLSKRADIVSLFDGVTDPNKIAKVGATRQWNLDPSTAAVFTTSEFYGCTVLIVADGKSVIIGHYGEVSGKCETMTDQNAVNSKIIKPFQDSAAMADFDGNTQAWIINTGGKNTVGYKSIVASLEDFDMDRVNIHEHRYAGGAGTGSFPGVPKGKAVVEWVPKADGTGATLKIYIENNEPIFTEVYDCNGNPVPAGNQKRDGPVCALTTSVPTTVTPEPSNAPSCTYVDQEPPEVSEAFWTCGSSSLPLETVTDLEAVHSSCGCEGPAIATSGGGDLPSTATAALTRSPPSAMD
ncbi:MAG: hypothetical protein M1837_000311 [Sclerophora amabilis]|nr:MAG: hypothetical protein M1837_000311 [Sclerophora amabilis]